MRQSFTAQAAFLIAIAVCLPSCVLKKPQTVKAAPPPPAPTTAAAPAPPPAPLSIPQTDVHLPPPQPVSSEAAATALPPEEPAAVPAPPRPAPKPKPAAPRPAETPAPVATPAGPAAPPEHPPVEEATNAADQKRFQDEASARKREVHQLIDPLDRRRLNRRQRGLLERIDSFLKQSDDAEGRGEMRQSSELAQRALVLARELKP